MRNWGYLGVGRHTKKRKTNIYYKHIVNKDKIFISHSNKDIKIIDAFVEKILILGLEISSERIFCTSMDGHGVQSGQYIPDRLREVIKNSSLALLFVSKNYKSSEICLNEVGAAWVTLEKESVIPLLFPDIDFSELGFLNISRLGLKIFERQGILKLIQDNKVKLNPSFNLERLNKQIDLFLKDIENSNTIENTTDSFNAKNDDFTDCFERNLYPFDEIIRKSIPALDEGIHKIEDIGIQNKLLFELNELKLNRLWYRHSGGDFHISELKKLPTGNWLINSRWEIKVSSMWVSMDVELGYEFILIHSEKLEPYKINSDIGGECHYVGILNDGTIISQNEYYNNFAVIGGQTINVNDYNAAGRYRDLESRWIFFMTYYHKTGFNSNETIDFCAKLDSGEIEVNEENIMNFLSGLVNNHTITAYR